MVSLKNINSALLCLSDTPQKVKAEKWGYPLDVLPCFFASSLSAVSWVPFSERNGATRATCSRGSCPMAGSWNWMILKIHPNPNHSVTDKYLLFRGLTVSLELAAAHVVPGTGEIPETLRSPQLLLKWLSSPAVCPKRTRQCFSRWGVPEEPRAHVGLVPNVLRGAALGD